MCKLNITYCMYVYGKFHNCSINTKTQEGSFYLRKSSMNDVLWVVDDISVSHDARVQFWKKYQDTQKMQELVPSFRDWSISQGISQSYSPPITWVRKNQVKKSSTSKAWCYRLEGPQWNADWRGQEKPWLFHARRKEEVLLCQAVGAQDYRELERCRQNQSSVGTPDCLTLIPTPHPPQTQAELGGSSSWSSTAGCKLQGS